MNSIAISGSPRENVGKRDAKELRYEGKVPAVLYGGKQQLHFAVEKSALKNLIYSADVMFVDLDVAGQKVQAILQDAQFHPLTEGQIEFYVDKYKPYDKAGAYAIQEWIGVVGIKGVKGDFYNVMGLPVSRVVQILQEF